MSFLYFCPSSTPFTEILAALKNADTSSLKAMS